MSFLFSLYFFTLIFFISSKPIKLSFKTRFNKNDLNKDNIMNILINNYIITNISFGSNNQTFEMSIKLQNDSTFVLSDSCPQNMYAKKFKENLSETYEIIKEKDKYYMYAFEFATIAKDSIILYSENSENEQNIKINNFKFMVANTLWYDTLKDMSGTVGLILTNKEDDPQCTDFITQLKLNKKIDSEIFVLDYQDNYNGFLYIGNYFHEFNENYLEKDLLKINVGNDKSQKKSWEINIEKIMIKKENNQNELIQNKTYIRLYYEIGVISGPKNFHDYIKNNFFEKYLNSNICQEYLTYDEFSTYDKYNYIVCNKSDFNQKLFPELSFFNSERNFTFILNNDDLFYEFENKIYCLIIFPIYPIDVDYWYIGKPLLLKYKLFMDKDNKVIGLYEYEYNNNNNNNNNSKEDNGKKENYKFNFIYIIIIILLIILVIGILYYFLVIKKTRKKRANELEDNDYEFSSKKDKEDALNINN